MKRFLMICLIALVAVSAFAGGSKEKAAPAAEGEYANIKIGFIFLHDPASSTYDNNFYQAALQVQKKLGLSDSQVIFKWNVEEGAPCYETACDMADAGCNIVVADSFGHETYMIQAAREYPNVQFCHATGTKSRTEGVANFHNAFASIYEGRFLAGIAAGMKINEMIAAGKFTADKAKIGYIAAYPYAEVISGYTSFFLGARHVCPTATMEVTYTNSWFDIAKEKTGAETLINDGCIFISQHADSEGAPKACEEKGVPNVAYNVSTINLGPNTALISSKINWAPYYEMIIKAVAKGESFATDWCGTVETGSVELTELNEKVAAKGTKEALEKAAADLKSGKLHVFDTKAFTVGGKHLTEYLADVIDKGDFQPETNVIVDGVFVESGEQFRSAPYFDMLIDGIKKYE
ncbi:MAG: BMP family ABC transporter substrate-binding protein [Spirochaetia bacterium]|nr:BMP family ABC transporter substrate-binding protein [Spirochaetia bacterium]